MGRNKGGAKRRQNGTTELLLRIVTSERWRTYYTLSAFIDFPITTAIHSPAGVECPVFIIIGAICGDHARFVISFCPEYAIIGSVSTRFFPSDGLGELSRELAFRGDATGAGA